MIWVFLRVNFQMFGLKFLQIWVISTHLKLWMAAARHNFKWVEIYIFNVAL